MTRIAALFTTIYLVTSCNQSPESNQDQNPTTSNDTTKILGLTKTDANPLNIDGLTATPENFRLLLENDHVRMLEYTLKPGEKDIPHTHPAKAAYVVSGGKIKVYLDNGETEIFDEKTGTADWSDGAGKHYVENIGNTPVTIVLTEIKSLQ